MTDIIGITSALDHIIYMTLNVIATLLWRLDAAIIGMSLYSYGTQDWLTGNSGGGVWGVLEWLIGSGGLAGTTTWTLFGGLALMLWGLAKIAKPFISFQPVDLGKLIIFFVLSYTVISQGTTLMPAIEAWREGAGSVVYEAIAGSDAAVIDVPAPAGSTDVLGTPSDLDGTGVIRGWEAVATSYFLVTDASDLHRSYPPDEFLRAYCLYNPEVAINTQNVTNTAGCSPMLAWDEWNSVSIDILRESYGIDLDPILTPIRDFFAWFGIDFDFTTLITTVPVIRHDPAMRELGNRQAQAGIARLAMGIIIAIFPMVEANISLMLALAASFIYITLPIALLFGFFLPTESMVNRLFMQFAAVVLRTIIIQGVVALFMLMLTNTAATGSLTAYFGLVGVGLIGGWVLMGIATSTMKETFSQSVGAVSSIWMGSATGLLGQGAAAPAAAVLGAAKLAGGGALLATAAMNHSLTSAWELSDPVSDANRSGMNDLRYGAPGAAAMIDKTRGRLPEPLSRLTAQLGLATGAEAEAAGKNGVDPLALLPGSQLAAQFGLTAGGEAADQRQASTTNGQSGRNGGGQPGRQPLYDSEPSGAGRWGAMAMGGLAAPGLAAAGLAAGMMGGGTDQRTARQQRNAAVDQWMGQTYKARETQTGQKRASETGRSLLGEELAWKAERAMERHTPAEVSAVVAAARAAAEENGQGDLVKNGRLTKKAVEEVQKRLDPEAAKAFQGDKGAWDLAALTAVGLQERKQAEPEEFRQAMAKSKSGWGENSPAHKVPKELGLDPVAAGSSYTAMNRFARLADNAHLSEKQREQLLKEAQTGKVSDRTRAELEKTIAEQQKQGRAQSSTADALIAGAAAVPATIAGPQQVWTTPAKPQVQGTGDPQQANLGMELKKKDKKKGGTLAEAVTDTVAGVVGVAGTVAGVIPGVGDAAEVIGEGAAGVLRTGVRVGEGKYQDAAVELAVGAARTAVAAAPISILTGPAKYAADKGVRYAAQQVQGGEPGSGRASGQAGGSGGGRPPGHIVEPMAAAPTMASASGASRSTGEPGSRPEPGQGAGFGQELKAASMGQAPGSAPAGRASAGEGNAQAGNAPVNRAPIAGGSPGLARAPAAGPSVGATPNMTAPIGVSSSPASYSSTPGGPGQGSGFSQELRDVAQGPASTGGASFTAGVPVIDPTPGAAPVFYGGGEPAPGSGSGREQRPLWEQQQAPPPVSNSSPLGNQPAVDFSAGRAPIGNMTPDWSSDQQPPAAAAPAVDFSANMGIPAAMGGPASFSSGSGLGQGSGFSQELRDAVQDPSPIGGGMLFADVPVMDNTPGAAPTFYGGSEPAPGNGPAQEYQPMFWEQQQAPPPPVSSPPPMTNQPAVDFSAGRAPIGNMTPNWSSDQQPPAAAAPAVDFSANMGIPAAMGGPASFSSGSGLGQGSGFSQELRDVVQDPFPPMGGGSLFADVPVMDNNPGGAAPVFYGSSEPAPGSSPAQEYQPMFWEQQQAPPPPVSSPPPMTNQPAVDFSANRAPIGNMTPDWSSNQQPPAATAPAVDFSANMGLPSAMGGPASFSSGSGLGQSSGFSQELRETAQSPSPIGGAPFNDAPAIGSTPGAAPAFPGGSELASGSGSGQERRPMFWEQQPAPPPPVSSPPPMTNRPAVDFSATRTPINSMAPDWSSHQQQPPAAAPATNFASNMGAPTNVGGTTTFSSAGSGLGQNSGFGQELRAAAPNPTPAAPPMSSPPLTPPPAPAPMPSQPVTPPPAPAPMPSQSATPPPAPAPMPSQPVTPPPAPVQMPSQPVSPPQPARQPIGSATGGAPAVESMAPPPRTNPASASTPPISTPPVMPPTGQSVTPPPPQPAQRSRSGGGVAAPVQPPPARTSATGPAPSAPVQPPPARTPAPPAQTSTQSTTESKKTFPRGGNVKKENKGKKG